jgi:hypothetical protein
MLLVEIVCLAGIGHDYLGQKVKHLSLRRLVSTLLFLYDCSFSLHQQSNGAQAHDRSCEMNISSEMFFGRGALRGV